MTKDEILATTGEQLQILVALAQGWEWKWRYGVHWTEHDDGIPVAGTIYWRLRLVPPDLCDEFLDRPCIHESPLAWETHKIEFTYVFEQDSYMLMYCPYWHTEIERAWELVEELVMTHKVVGVNCVNLEAVKFDARWEARAGGHIGKAETASKAICRAYLLAKLAQDED